VTGSLPFTRGSQFAVEEFGGGAVGADPIAPAEQVVNFVGDSSGTAGVSTSDGNGCSEVRLAAVAVVVRFKQQQVLYVYTTFVSHIVFLRKF
jgi:hypothetical protein